MHQDSVLLTHAPPLGWVSFPRKTWVSFNYKSIKNWLFSNSVDGANASAVVYTMVEMAKAHSLNVYGYLKFLLEHRPSEDMTDEQLAELAPWSEKLQSIKNRSEL